MLQDEIDRCAGGNDSVKEIMANVVYSLMSGIDDELMELEEDLRLGNYSKSSLADRICELRNKIF